MVSTRKFSEFTDGGDLSNDKITVGLGNSGNTKYNNPWTFLPDGTTGDRPAPSADMYFRLRFNTTTKLYEYYNSVSATWVVLEDEASILALLASHLVNQGASLIGLQNQSTVIDKTVQDLANATLIAQTNNGTLANGQFLSVLSTGIVKNTTSTGVLSILTGSSLITAIINDDTFATAAVTNIPTALSVKNYIASVIASSAGGSNGELQYNNAGAFGGDSITTDGLGNWTGTLSLTGQLNVDNLRLDGNTLSSTDSNGNILIQPNGTGVVLVNTSVAFSNGVSGPAQVQAVGTGTTNGGFSSGSFGSVGGGLFSGYRSRSTVPGVFTTVQPGDILARIQAYADDGTQFVRAGYMHWNVGTTIGVGAISSTFQIVTYNTAGATRVGFTLDQDGVPAFPLSPLGVGSGGSGLSTLSTYRLLAGGTTATGAFQQVTSGTSGQFLQSAGAGALPSWSTATFPATSGSAGTILRSNGTNWVNSTSTFADTYTASNLLYSNGANTVTGLATANNGILVTSGTGVPSIGNTVGAGLTMPSITFNSTSGIIGSSTNDSAAAGSVGEIISSVIASGSAVGLSSGSGVNVTSISLTAGDWDIWGNISFIFASGTTTRICVSCINSVSSTLTDSSLYNTWIVATAFAPHTIGPIGLSAPSYRVSINSTTTYYLVAFSTFSVSTATACGGIYARRRR